MPFERIAILGCGLIGGSFALGMKKQGFKGEIIGWDRPGVLEKARARRAIDRAEEDLAAAVSTADLIYLATPVVTILNLLPEIGQAAKQGALVTDTGSTKARICRMAREVLPAGVHFLGGHPMAGKETAGIANADARLFVETKYVVVREANEAEEPNEAGEGAAGPSVTEFLHWILKLEAEPVALDAETHDWAVAMVSHAPQLLSIALASTVWDETDDDGLPLALAAGGFRDMVRLAGSSYDMWRDICLTNRENIRRALERLEQRIERMRGLLDSKDLAEEFRKAQQTASQVKPGRGKNG